MWGDRKLLLEQIADLKARCEFWESQYIKERERNISHEDALTSRLVTATRNYGVPSRIPTEKPAVESRPQRLNALQEAKLEMYESSAEEAGFTRAHGRKKFFSERASPEVIELEN